jgi:hypothetical protein
MLERQLGGVAGEVGEGAGLADAADGLGDLGEADLLGDGLDRAAIVFGELLGLVGVGVDLPGLFDLDPGRVASPGDPGADDDAGDPADDHGVEAVLEPADVLDLGDGADPGVAGLEARDEDELSVLVTGSGDRRSGLGGLEHERDDHAGENHPGGEGKKRKNLRIKLFGHDKK